MSKYPTVKLGDVCIIERGGSPRPINKFITKDPNGINWIKIGDTSADSMYITKTAEKIIPEGVLKSRQVKKGDFILSNSMSFGRPYILNIDGCIHDGWLLIRDINDIFEKQFLYYYLSSETVYANLKQMAVGGVVNNLNSNKVRSLMVPVLKKEDQVKICNKLNKITTVIQQRKQQLSKLDELAKSRFLEMFGDPILNPMGWAISHYGDEFEIMSGGTPKTDIPEYWVNGKISWIGSNLCQNSVLIENDGKFITEKGLNNSSAKIFNKGYILIALVGATIGKVAHLKFSTSTNQNIAGINVPQNENYIPEFVFYNTQFLYPKFMDIGNSKFKMANLSFIRSLQIPIVPIKAQKKFSNFVEQLDKSKFRIKKSLEKLEMTYKALLQEYFG